MKVQIIKRFILDLTENEANVLCNTISNIENDYALDQCGLSDSENNILDEISKELLKVLK